jgi:hypothetical protein
MQRMQEALKHSMHADLLMIARSVRQIILSTYINWTSLQRERPHSVRVCSPRSLIRVSANVRRRWEGPY